MCTGRGVCLVEGSDIKVIGSPTIVQTEGKSSDLNEKNSYSKGFN